MYMEIVYKVSVILHRVNLYTNNHTNSQRKKTLNNRSVLLCYYIKDDSLFKTYGKFIVISR